MLAKLKHAKMSIPTLRDMVGRLSKTLLRFPSPIAAALLATLMTLFQIHDFAWESDRLFVTAILAFFLLLAVNLISERWALAWPAACGITVVLLVLLVLRVYTSTIEHALWLMFLAPCLVLLPTFAPFVAPKATDDAFWDFNRASWLSAGLGLGAAVIMALGLMSGLYAIDQLFPVDIADNAYQNVLVLTFGLLWPCIALSGIPKNFAVPSMQSPWGLKLLVSRILVPLITIFLVILYAYLAKIAMFRELPDGQVAMLVSLYATSGVATYLLSFPWRTSGDALIRLYHRWFFPALIPLIGLLAIALERRISDYGVTEARYAVGLFGLWLVLCAATHFLSKRAQLRSLPLSLAGLLLMASFGPWGAEAMSTRSQLSHFETLLERNHMLAEGNIRPASGDVDWDDNKRMSSIIQYFYGRGMEERLIVWLGARGFASQEIGSQADMARGLGMELVQEWQDYPRFDIPGRQVEQLAIDGFDYLMRFYLPKPFDSNASNQNGVGDYALTFDAESLTLVVSADDGNSLAFSFRPLIDEHRSGTASDVPQDLVLEEETETLRARIHLRQLHGYIKAEGPHVQGADGVVLIERVR